MTKTVRSVRFFNIIIVLSCLMALSTVKAQNYYVYDDQFKVGGPTGVIGEKGGSSISMSPAFSENPYKGAACWRIKINGQESWAGFFYQKNMNFRKFLAPDAEYADLSQYKYLIFHARSDTDYTINEVGIGEEGEPRKKETKIPLTTTWKRYVLEVPAGANSMNGLFSMFVGNKQNVIYLDEIYFTNDLQPEASDMMLSGRKIPKDTSSYYIYMDGWEKGIPSGFMGEKNGISMDINPDCRVNPYLGPKCLRIAVDNKETWRGLHIFSSGKWNVMLQENTIKTLPDMTKYSALEFYARADVKKGSSYVLSQIGVGAGDMLEEKVDDVYLEIGSEWRRYTISLKGIDRDKVNTLLFMVLPEGTLYLDEIRYVR